MIFTSIVSRRDKPISRIHPPLRNIPERTSLLGSKFITTVPQSSNEHEEDGDTDTYGNETRELRGSAAAFTRPRHKDTRWWVRWPAQTWQLIGQRFVPWGRRGRRYEFRPAAHWWSRWLGHAWQRLQGSGGFYNNLLGPLLQDYLNLLLVFLPLVLIAVNAAWSPDIVLAFAFLAIVPLSGLVRMACEDISAHLNDTLGKVLVAFSDNLIELVVSNKHTLTMPLPLLTSSRLVLWPLLRVKSVWYNAV